MSNHGVKERTGHLNAVLLEYRKVELDVLTNFFDGCIGEKWLHNAQPLRSFCSVCGKVYVKGLARSVGKGKSYQLVV